MIICETTEAGSFQPVGATVQAMHACAAWAGTCSDLRGGSNYDVNGMHAWNFYGHYTRILSEVCLP